MISSTDRSPPFSEAAEAGILGCVFIDPSLIAQCIELLPDSRVFYDPRCAAIYNAMIGLFDERKNIDEITISQSLKTSKFTFEWTWLLGLRDLITSAANLTYYIDIVKEKFMARSLLQSCARAQEMVYSFTGPFTELTELVQRDISRALDSDTVKDLKPIKELVTTAIDSLERRHRNRGEIGGVKTGFCDFDKMTDGLHSGEMIVIAGRPSMGKTSLAMNIAEYVAVDCGMPVAIFSLEMTDESLVERMVCSRSRINVRNIDSITEGEMKRLTLASAKISAAPLYIDDTPGLTILQLRAKARRLFELYGIKLIVIDYLQLLSAPASRSENRQQEVSMISSGTKAMAKDLGVPVIVLSQLNRLLERDKHRAPRLSDLRESGAIEQDADLVAFLYNANPKDDEEDDEARSVMAVTQLIAKQRNGPTGPVHLTFFRQYTRFESASRYTDEDAPQANLPYKS